MLYINKTTVIKMSVPPVPPRLTEGVIAIPRDKLVQNYVLNSVFKTHKNLTLEDRSFAIEHILSLNLTNQELAKFILQTYQLSNTGRFSLTYNLDLDTHIQVRDSDRITTLVLVADTEKAWPELYNNSYLTPTEVETIKVMSNREYFALLNAVQMAGCAKDFEDIIPCRSDKTERLSVTKDSIYYNSVYSKCYDNVCLYEAEQKGKIVSINKVNNSEIPKVAYVADTTKNGTGKYCFPMMELVGQLAAGNYVNLETGNRFSERTLSQILTKYHKEIAMYKKYLEIRQGV